MFAYKASFAAPRSGCCTIGLSNNDYNDNNNNGLTIGWNSILFYYPLHEAHTKYLSVVLSVGRYAIDSAKTYYCNKWISLEANLRLDSVFGTATNTLENKSGIIGVCFVIA